MTTKQERTAAAVARLTKGQRSERPAAPAEKPKPIRAGFYLAPETIEWLAGQVIRERRQVAGDRQAVNQSSIVEKALREYRERHAED
jgi:hypothetical protein